MPDSSNLIETVHAENTGYLTDVGHDAFKVFAIVDFEREIDAGVQIVGVTGKGPNIRAGLAYDGGDVSEHPGSVLRTDHQRDRVDSPGNAPPININAPFDLIK